MRRSPSVRVHDLRPCTSDVFPANQLMHSWTCCVDRIKNDKIAIAITTTLKPNNGNGVTRALQIDWWQECLVHARAIADGCLGEVALDCEKEQVMGLNLALWRVLIAEHLYGTVDFGTKEKCLCLLERQPCGINRAVGKGTSGVPMYFLVSLIPPVCMRPT